MCACTSSAPSSSFLLPTMRRSTSQSYSISSPSSSAAPLASSSRHSTSSASSMYSSSSVAPAHRRSGVLRTTASQQDIARQRSQALLASVIRGDITLDAILAFPIDWASIALEEQELRREDERQRQAEAEEELLPTRNPLAIKRRESRTTVQTDEQPGASSSSSSLGLELGQPSNFVEAEAVAIPTSSSSASSSPVSLHSPMSLPPSLCSSPRSTASSEATLCEELATPKHQSALTFDEEDEENHSGYCSGSDEEAERKPRKAQRLDLNLDYDLTIPSSPSSPSRSLYNEDEEDESTSSFFAFTSSSSSSSKDMDPLDEMFDFGAPSDSTAFASREANDWMVWPTLSSATVF